jgi:hypothetical protein
MFLADGKGKIIVLKISPEHSVLLLENLPSRKTGLSKPNLPADSRLLYFSLNGSKSEETL